MRKFFAILLSVLMVLSILPGAALADAVEDISTAAKQTEMLNRGEPNPDWPEYNGLLYGYSNGECMGDGMGLYSFNPLTGDEPTFITELDGSVYAMAFNGSDGYIYGYTDRTFFKIDVDGNVVSESLMETRVCSMAYNCADGNLYAYDDGVGLAVVDTTSGELNYISASLQFDMPRIAIDNYGMIYLLDFFTLELYAYNLESGAGCAIGTVNSMGYPYGMCFDLVSGVLYLTTLDQGGLLFSIDPNTARCDMLLMFDYDFYGLTSIIPQDIEAPEIIDMESITLSANELTMDCYSTATLSATVMPANTTYALYQFTSSDENVATISELGVITARNAGQTTIRVSGLFAPDIYDECVVTVLDPTYPEYEENTLYGFLMVYTNGYNRGFYKINTETGALTAISTSIEGGYMSSAFFDPNAGVFRGFSRGGTMYTYSANGVLVSTKTILGLDQTHYIYGAAFDITTNTAYILVSASAMNSTKNLYRLDMETGELYPVATYDGELKVESIAVDGEGTMYGLECQGSNIYTINKESGELTLIGDTGLDTLFLQSITYDLASDKLYFMRYAGGTSWDNPVVSNLFEINTETAEATMVLDMNKMHFSGICAIVPEDYERPTTIPVQGVSFTIGGMNFKIGRTQDLMPFVNVYPSNATNKSVIFSSDNPQVGYVNKNGVVIACSEGTANITVTTVDGNYSATIYLNVSGYDYPEVDGMLHGFLESSNENEVPRGPVVIDIDNGDIYQSTLGFEYLAYSQDFCNIDGYVYGYTADTFFKATTDGIIVNSIPVESPAYEMAFDRTTGIMYALADDADGVRGLYTVNLETGERTLVGNPVGGQTLLTLAINSKGTAYGIACSTGNFYKVNLANGQLSMVAHTGLDIHMVSSATFNPNDDSIMYMGIFAEGAVQGVYMLVFGENGSLSLDALTAQAYHRHGVEGLYFITEQNDQGNEAIHITDIELEDTVVNMNVGDSYEVNCAVTPAINDDTLYFVSSDTSVVRISDCNNVIWAVGEGTATVTVVNRDSSVEEVITFNIGAYQKPAYDGTINGFFGSMDGSPSGWYTYELDGTGEFERYNYVYTPMSGEFNSTDGYVYVCEGYTYYNPNPDSFWYDQELGYVDEYYLNKMSVDGVIVSSVRCERIIHQLAYDVTTDTMYCIYISQDGNGLCLGTVNLETAEVSFIARLTQEFYTIAIDNDGVMYSVEMLTGGLYTIDKATGVGTYVGSTDIGYQYLTSMAFDRSTGVLYFADIRQKDNGAITTGIYAIDTETANAVPLFDPHAEVIGMFIVSYTTDNVELGDVNGDGVVNTADAVLVMRYAMGIIDDTMLNVDVADMDQNGRIEIADAIIILRMAMQL